MHKHSPLFALLLALVASACDYSIVENYAPQNGGGGASVSIVVTPGVASIAPGDTVRFNAVVIGSDNTTVTWSVVSGVGEIYDDGVFIAPAVSTVTTTTVRARASADTSETATAVVTIDPDAHGGGQRVLVAITPPRITIAANTTQQFTATVSGSTNTAVTWRLISGPGTLSSTGLYAAPSSLPSYPQSATIEAVAAADPTAIGRAVVIVTEAVDPNRICFDRDIQPIFLKNCAVSGCHDSRTAEHGIDFSTTLGIRRGVTPGSPQLSIIYRMITGQGKGDLDYGDDDNDGDDDDDDDDDNDDGDGEDDDIMPPPPRAPLSAQQIDLIRRWIAAGADTNACPPPPSTGCDTIDVSFATTVRAHLDVCQGCHAGGTDFNRNVDLSTITGVRAVAQSGQLLGALSHAPGFQPMPRGGAKLDDCSIAQIRSWIRDGMPNN